MYDISSLSESENTHNTQGQMLNLCGIYLRNLCVVFTNKNTSTKTLLCSLHKCLTCTVTCVVWSVAVINMSSK